MGAHAAACTRLSTTCSNSNNPAADGALSRPQPGARSPLQKVLTSCRSNKGRVHFVVVFNLTRFARDKYDHFALRSPSAIAWHLAAAGDGTDRRHVHKLMEGVLAAFAQFDNDVRPDRTKAGMRAALELGPLDVPRADRLSQRPALVRQEPCRGPRSRAHAGWTIASR